MGNGDRRLTGVVCDDRPEMRRAVTALLRSCGFEVAVQVDRFAPLREQVRGLQPAVAVLTLPLAGMTGLACVRTLRDDAPTCQVVLLSSFDQLEAAALAAGARALVPEDSPRALQLVLQRLAAELAAQASLVVPAARAHHDDDSAGTPIAGSAPPPDRVGSLSTNPSS